VDVVGLGGLIITTSKIGSNMSDRKLSNDELYDKARLMWNDLYDRSKSELDDVLEDTEVELLMDIANGHITKWPEELILLAKALKHQGEVQGILDDLRLLTNEKQIKEKQRR
jgi:hypothetical protein